jgi:hypothetical protein
MINCPNCDKQIADDSAHCGYCGHQLEEKNKKKTMFGMAALGGDELKKAVEEAKEAKQEKETGSGDAQGKQGGGLKIPKPGQGPKDEGEEKKAFKIPKPGQKQADSTADRQGQDQQGEDQQGEDQQGEDQQAGFAKTERIDLSDARSPHDADEEEDFSGETSAMDATPARQEATDQQDRPVVDDMGGPTEPTFGGPPMDEPAGPGPSQVSEAGAQSGPFGPGAKEAEQARDVEQDKETAPGSQPVQVSRAGSMPAGSKPAGSKPADSKPADSTPAGSPAAAKEGGFGQKEFNTTPPGQQASGNQNSQMQTQDQGEGKSKKGLIIGIVAATLLLGGGCVSVAGYFLLDYLGVL